MAANTSPSGLLGLVRIDFAPKLRPPRTATMITATVMAILGSLSADVILVQLGKSLFPAYKNYVHFQFSDYAKLTVIGVVIACAAWPIVTRISSAPQWVFFRLAILVTVVLLLPDVYIWHQGQPAKAVAVLMVMHLAIAVVTYNVLVYVAPCRQPRRAPRHARTQP